MLELNNGLILKFKITFYKLVPKCPTHISSLVPKCPEPEVSILLLLAISFVLDPLMTHFESQH